MKYLFFIWILSYLTMDTSDSISMQDSIKEEFMDLEYLVRTPQNGRSKAPVLMLLHGYGSNETDLFSFSNQIPDNWLVVSVRAPFALAQHQFKWYTAKLVHQKISMNFEEEEKSRKLLLKLIDQIALKYNVDKDKLVTAGFSQGANMALGLALTEPKKILAAGCFSGRFMEEIQPLINKEALPSKQVFIAHGTEDQMLPLKYAEENKARLQEMGIKVTFVKDKIGHSISNKEFEKFIAWLNTL